MTLYEELKARGLVAQITDEEIIDLINNGKATFYIGFDCTADSLTAGHFMALTLMKRLQMAGNKPIALIGGGTTMIGDPSGRTDMRKMLTKEDIDHNAECFKRQMERFIDFSDGKALMLYNSEWLKPLNYIELLREVVRAIGARGWHIVNIDSTVAAQAPKLRPYIDEMRRNIADACSLDFSCVSVKATTEEGLGFTGRREGISASAVCLIEK